MANHLLKLVVICLVVVMNTHQVHGQRVNITHVTDARAVCNDGSSAAYYYSPGFEEGVNSWLIHLQGGGWCWDDASCIARFNSTSGSTKQNAMTEYFIAFKSAKKKENPDFYNWNRINVMYCDSSSFMGLTDHPNIAGRGARIFEAVVKELFQRGMVNATNAILSGLSAGGLAAILHCDAFRALLPESSQVKCVIDSGFFVHAPKLHGAEMRASLYANIVAYHGFINELPLSCTSRMNASLCIFPEYIVKDIQTPLFLVESRFDQYQMLFNFVRDEGVGSPYEKCIGDLKLCTPSQLESMKDYGVSVTELLQNLRDSSSIGMFVHPCLRHGHFFQWSGWNKSYKLRDKTIAQAVGDWFYGRDVSFQEIDNHEFPLNCTELPNICEPLDL